MLSIRKQQVKWLRGAAAAGSVLALAACAQYAGSGSSSGLAVGGSSLYAAEKANNFRLSLTDAPHDELQQVVVNVDHAELLLEGGGKEARVMVAENLGAVDLLTLQNGVTLPMADLNIPPSVSVRQIRLVLAGEGNYIIKSDGSRCDLKTPSAQKTGIKFIISDGVLIEKGFSYAIVADFDAHKSIVLTGNGGCLLKPVLKLKSATRIELPDDDDDGDDGNDGDDGDVGDVDGGSGDGSTPDSSPTPAPAPEVAPTPAPEATPAPIDPAPVATPTPTPSPTPVPEMALAPSGSTQVGDSSGWDTSTTTTSPTVSPVNLDMYF